MVISDVRGRRLCLSVMPELDYFHARGVRSVKTLC